MFKFNIGIVTAGLAIDPQTFGQTALGGSETALICMARALGAEGQKVTVFCVLDGPQGQRDPVSPNVQYFHVNDFDAHMLIRNFDAMIVSRHIGYALKNIRAGTIWYWAHDIAPQGGFDDSAFLVDRMLFLTNYHRGLYEATLHKGFYPLMRVTRNGIEADRIELARTSGIHDPDDVVLSMLGRNMRKHANRFCYTSRPERGAMFLLGSIWPQIRKQIPDATLHLAWYQVKNMAIMDSVQRDIDFVASLVQQSEHLGVHYHGALSKDDLYGMIQSCNAMLYPCTFPESSCITAIEAMALGTFPITTNAYALPETLGEYGYLIDGHPGTPDYDDAFIKTAVDLYEQFDDVRIKDNRFEMSAFIRMHHDWKTIAKEWIIDLDEFFRMRFADNYARVLDNHLYHSDVTAVRDFCDNFGGQWAVSLAPYFNKARAMLDVCQTNKEEYMRGASHTHWRENGRFLKAIELLAPTLETATMVTDVGCGTGDFLACLHMRYPHLMLVGMDFSEECIAEAKAFVAGIEGADPSKFTFHVRTVEQEWTTECFDAVFCGEVLEHVENTQDMLTKIEGLVKPGGRVCITTPLGPWSQIAFRKEGPGIERHIHHFTMTDLQEILAGRGTTITMDYISAGTTERGEAIGNIITTWNVVGSGADRKPFGYVNVEKKIITGRPYQKISACIIARNEEENILKCLKSLDRIVDEIIIGNVESTDGTSEVIKLFAKTHHTPMSFMYLEFDQDGDGLGNFSAWKNAVLKHALGDWTLCIDCDEVMANGRFLRKYLDTPSLNAYAVQQIHVSIGEPITTNTPHRLIRNNKGYVYKGVIHEHPHAEGDGYEFIEPFLILTDVTLPHTGYLMEETRYYKAAIRNLPMVMKDRAKNPDRIYGKVMEMRDVLNIAKWARNKLGMLRGEDVEALRKLILVYEEHFSEHGNFFYADANRYYQDALAILAILNVVPYGQRHIALHAQLQTVVSQGPLRQPNIDAAPPMQRWFKGLPELRSYLNSRVDLMEKAMGPLALPIPDHKPKEVPQSLLSDISVP